MTTPPVPHLPSPTSESARKVRTVELLISNLLRIGVGTSVAVIVLGVLLFFARHPEYRAASSDYQTVLHGSRIFPHTVADVFTGLAAGRGQAFIMAGLFLLIATPVMRVAVSIFAFLYQKDRPFALITTIVLALLLLSFALGKVTH